MYPAIYAYRHNFNGKNTKGKPKKNKATIKLLELLRPGARTICLYGDDYFVSIIQYFIRKGYPRVPFISDERGGIEKFLNDVLFSVDPWLFEDLYINERKFSLIKFREQFDILTPIVLDGLNYYKERAAMPIPQFHSFDETKDLIFKFKNKYNAEERLLKHPFNSHHPKANTIFGAYIRPYANYLTYTIVYGYEEDYKADRKSSWDIVIKSEDNENYIDFCLRIQNNFEAIKSGDMSILEAQTDWLCTSFKIKILDEQL